MPRYGRKYVLWKCNKILNPKGRSLRQKELRRRQIALSKLLARGMHSGQEFPICVSRKAFDVITEVLGDSGGLADYLVRTAASVGGKAIRKA